MSHLPLGTALLSVLLSGSIEVGAAPARAAEPADARPAAGRQSAKGTAPKAGDAAKAGGTPKADASPKNPYLRLLRSAAGTPIALQTAIVRFVPRDCGQTSPTVDLVAAVHVAEPSYYRQLNRAFDDYDAVLYELVAPPGTKIPEGGIDPNRHPVSALQNAMKNMLQLEFQLNAVRYNRPNMVHADMSPDQFAKSMSDKGESLWTMFLRMMGYALAKQAQDPNSGNDFSLLIALFDPHRALALKRVLAEQFEDMEGSLTALEGPQGSTLISERNKVAIGVLKKQIKAGKIRLAIFYGAGHMGNMEERLRDELDLVPINTHWLTAWDMADSSMALKPARK